MRHFSFPPDSGHDLLLRVMTGHSLKEEGRLWEAFQNLRSARNAFAHEGRAVLGGVEVTPEKAAELIGHAKAIADWVERLLPVERKRPKLGRAVKIDVTFQL
jgi:hypothetical protein